MKSLIITAACLFSAAALFGQDITLPRPAAKSGIDLLSAVADRSVARTFVKKDVSMQDLSTILWSGLGLRPVDAVASATRAGRTASFSGDNPYINLYVLTEKGAWKYIPETNRLESRSGKDIRAEVSTGTIPASAFTILFTVDTALTPAFLKSNPGLFQQMSHATAGFAAQNIALTASALRMPSIIKYTLNAQVAASALKLAKDEIPLFTLQAGYAE